MHLAIIGSQCGDEGKGKYVDLYAARADVIARFQGGPHTGHTVVFGNRVIKYKQVPAGVIDGKTCVVGNGCVIDPVGLCEEIAALEEQGLTVDLRIANTAHVVFPYHRAQDAAMEAWRGAEVTTTGGSGLRDGTGQIGSTKTGVGPCREDKIARIGLRMVDLLDTELLHTRLSRLSELKRRSIAALSPAIAEDPNYQWDTAEMVERYAACIEKLRGYLCDTSAYLLECHAQGQTILFEGAQSINLDIEHGTYPFCSSGYSAASGIAVGAGLPLDTPVAVCGVVKAYMTRVGGGPMPTEINDATAERIAEVGREYGTVTGRRRRIGWLDLAFIRRGVQRDGVRRICLSALDVLAGLEQVQVATHYRLGSQTLDSYPESLNEAARVEPVYQTLPGWPAFDGAEVAARGREALPEQARAYLDLVAEQLGVEIVALGVGRDREQTLQLADPYLA